MAKDLKVHYTELLKTHGRNIKAVQLVSTADQYKRFEIICQNISEQESVIDLGCGLGDMLKFLREKGFKGKYLGADFVEGFINANEDYFVEDNNASFTSLDIVKDVLPSSYDHVILSGVFNNIMQDNDEFMRITLQKMFKAARRSIRFNMMSTYVDYQADDLYYFDPREVFDFCKNNLSGLVTLRHDYGLGENNFAYEFSIFVKKA